MSTSSKSKKCEEFRESLTCALNSPMMQNDIVVEAEFVPINARVRSLLAQAVFRKAFKYAWEVFREAFCHVKGN